MTTLSRRCDVIRGERLVNPARIVSTSQCKWIVAGAGELPSGGPAMQSVQFADDRLAAAPETLAEYPEGAGTGLLVNRKNESESRRPRKATQTKWPK